jgi:hypothetical protein
MEGNVETLVRENVQLQHENAELAHQRAEHAKRVDILHEQIAWFKQRFFSRSSEALSEKDKRQRQTATNPTGTCANCSRDCLPRAPAQRSYPWSHFAPP